MLSSTPLQVAWSALAREKENSLSRIAVVLKNKKNWPSLFPKVGNANIVEMVNTLRQAAGQSISDENSLIESENARVALAGKAPTAITFTLDVRPVLEKGEHPKELVMREANRLQAGECMELLTPFPPVPLIELLEKKGFAVTMVEPGDGVVRTFIHR